MQEKLVTIPPPPQEVIQVPKYIEHHPQIVENLIYVQKPPIAPQVITQTVQELLPQETVVQEVVKHVQAPKLPPVYQEVIHHVQAKPPAWAVPNKAIPNGPVLKTESKLVHPGGARPAGGPIPTPVLAQPAPIAHPAPVMHAPPAPVVQAPPLVAHPVPAQAVPNDTLAEQQKKIADLKKKLADLKAGNH